MSEEDRGERWSEREVGRERRNFNMFIMIIFVINLSSSKDI